MKKKLNVSPGQAVRIVGDHPHVGEAGVAVSYGPYGPASFRWMGWLVRGDDGEEFYARCAHLQALPSTEQQPGGGK